LNLRNIRKEQSNASHW